MAKIEGQILIDRPVEEVFDYVADSRNEPSFNPAMTGMELLTPPPIGVGTRFRARMGRAGTPMLVELTEFDRPHRLGGRMERRIWASMKRYLEDTAARPITRPTP